MSATPAEILHTPFVHPEVFVEETFGEDTEHMLRIATCESGRKQFVNGEPLVSHTNDWGYFQINEATWDIYMVEQGLDYKNDVYDNILAAKLILDIQGHSAWVCNRLI